MFLARQGTLESLKVLDFGISKAPLSGQVFGDDLSTREQDWVMGTPLYMSPEQLRHAPDLDERTDIWSLGTVLYELLTGEPRFSGDTHTQVARQVLSAPAHVEAPLQLAGVPAELRRVIRRCLAQERRERFANVAELARALAPFAPPSAQAHVERAMALLGLEVTEVSDEDIEDLDVAPFEEVPRPRPRSAGLQVAALILAGVAVVLGWQYVQTSSSSRARPFDATKAHLETERLALRPAPRSVVPGSAEPASMEPASTEPASPEPASTEPAATAGQATSSTPLRAAPVSPVSPSPQPERHAAADIEDQTRAAPAGPARRLMRPKPVAQTTFRLIAEPPRTKFALLPPKPPEQPGIQLVQPK
jgi:serine/threonine-protein kinase